MQQLPVRRLLVVRVARLLGLLRPNQSSRPYTNPKVVYIPTLSLAGGITAIQVASSKTSQDETTKTSVEVSWAP